MKRVLPAWPGAGAPTRGDAAGPVLASERPAASRAAVAVFGQPLQAAAEFAVALVDACRAAGREASVLIVDADGPATGPLIAALRAAGAADMTNLPDRAAVEGALLTLPPDALVVGVGVAFAEAVRSLLTVEVGPGSRMGMPRPGVGLALTRPSHPIAEQVAACLVESVRGESGLSAR